MAPRLPIHRAARAAPRSRWFNHGDGDGTGGVGAFRYEERQSSLSVAQFRQANRLRRSAAAPSRVHCRSLTMGLTPFGLLTRRDAEMLQLVSPATALVRRCRMGTAAARHSANARGSTRRRRLPELAAAPGRRLVRCCRCARSPTFAAGPPTAVIVGYVSAAQYGPVCAFRCRQLTVRHVCPGATAGVAATRTRRNQRENWRSRHRRFGNST